jgi:hypothetical protein
LVSLFKEKVRFRGLATERKASFLKIKDPYLGKFVICCTLLYEISYRRNTASNIKWLDSALKN